MEILPQSEIERAALNSTKVNIEVQRSRRKLKFISDCLIGDKKRDLALIILVALSVTIIILFFIHSQKENGR